MAPLKTDCVYCLELWFQQLNPKIRLQFFSKRQTLNGIISKQSQFKVQVAAYVTVFAILNVEKFSVVVFREIWTVVCFVQNAVQTVPRGRRVLG